MYSKSPEKNVYVLYFHGGCRDHYTLKAAGVILLCDEDNFNKIPEQYKTGITQQQQNYINRYINKRKEASKSNGLSMEGISAASDTIFGKYSQ